jgi:hypothetical protein
MMSDEARTEAEAAALAKSRGCCVVYPKPDQLFVDIDNETQWQRFVWEIAKHREWHWRDSPSPSGLPYRKHIIVTLPEAVDERTRVFYQAILGSDPAREMIAWRRLQAGDTRPTCFFEKIESEKIK